MRNSSGPLKAMPGSRAVGCHWGFQWIPPRLGRFSSITLQNIYNMDVHPLNRAFCRLSPIHFTLGGNAGKENDQFLGVNRRDFRPKLINPPVDVFSLMLIFVKSLGGNSSGSGRVYVGLGDGNH